MVNESMYQLGAVTSCIRELFEYGLKRVQEVGAEKVYDYSLGNPSVPAPEALNEAIRVATTEASLSTHGYTPAAGAPAVRAAIAEDLKERFGMEIRGQDIFITCGAAPALTAVMRALAVENAEILGIAPFFAEYTVFAEKNGCRFVVVPADEEHFQIDLAALEARITPNTQAVLINSPNNPSGTVYSEATLRALAAVLTKKAAEYGKPIYLISDEPYRELVYDDAVVPFVPTLYPDTIVCYSYSKSLSLPGDRIGYVLIPPAVTDHDTLFKAVAGAARAAGHVCAPAIMQKAIGRCTKLRPDITVYDRNRSILYEALSSYGYRCVKPQGAFYMFVEAPGGDAKAFSDAAKAKDLLIVPGGDFGCPRFFRLGTCVATDMIYRSLPVFEALIKEYK